jgi:hypothetical protein
MVKALLSFLSTVLVLLCLVGCQASPNLASIQVTPNTATLTYAGQTVQFKAIGTYVHVGHPGSTQDITNQVSWASSNASISTVSSSGVATAIGVGSTTISATLRDSGNSVVGSAALTSASGQPAHSLESITVIPGPTSPCVPVSQPSCPVVTSVGEPEQFIAIGNYNTDPLTVDVTNQVLWQSSDVKVATINSAGLALANYAGITTITAIGKASNGADIAGTSALQVTIPGGGVSLPLLSVYEVGLGNGTVTSDPVGINCTAGAGCTGNFVAGTAVTLTAVPFAGSTFGGWSSNCLPDTAATTSCTIIMNNNEPVGAIFNTSN